MKNLLILGFLLLQVQTLNIKLDPPKGPDHQAEYEDTANSIEAPVFKSFAIEKDGALVLNKTRAEQAFLSILYALGEVTFTNRPLFDKVWKKIGNEAFGDQNATISIGDAAGLWKKMRMEIKGRT